MEKLESLELPANSLFDLLVVFSFYNFAKDCTIVFSKNGGKYVAFIEGKNLRSYTLDYVKKTCNDIKANKLFGLEWRSKKSQMTSDGFPYNPKGFNGTSNDPRSYAHERKTLIKENKKEYFKSPLITTSRQDKFFSVLSDLVKKDFFTEDRILVALGFEKAKDSVKVNGKDPYAKIKLRRYTFNLIDRAVPNNANIIPFNDKTIPVKSLFIPAGISLFPSHFGYYQVLVDGYHYKQMLLALPSYPANLQEWRAIQRHPHIGKIWKRGEFWNKTAKILCIRRFRRGNLNKGPVFESIS